MEVLADFFRGVLPVSRLLILTPRYETVLIAAPTQECVGLQVPTLVDER